MKEFMGDWVIFCNLHTEAFVVISLVITLCVMVYFSYIKIDGTLTFFPIWLLVWFSMLSAPISLPVCIGFLALHKYFRGQVNE